MISLQKKLVGRAVRIGLRNISTSNILRKTYYDVLGISRDATQADIKNAYFELSKLYHPDRIAATDENLAKFREISAAYEVLGNEQSRKLYDRGLLGDSAKTFDEPDEVKDPIIKFYKQRQDLSKSLATQDMNAWAQTYFKDEKTKASARKHLLYKVVENKNFPTEDPKNEGFAFLVVGITVFLFLTNIQTPLTEKLFGKSVAS